MNKNKHADTSEQWFPEKRGKLGKGNQLHGDGRT